MLYRAPTLNAWCQLAQLFVTSLLGLYWVVIDSRERGYETSKALRICICLAAIVAIPYYLLRSRGIKGIVSIVVAAGFVILLNLIEDGSAWVTWYIRTR